MAAAEGVAVALILSCIDQVTSSHVLLRDSPIPTQTDDTYRQVRSGQVEAVQSAAIIS